MWKAVMELNLWAYNAKKLDAEVLIIRNSLESAYLWEKGLFLHIALNRIRFPLTLWGCQKHIKKWKFLECTTTSYFQRLICIRVLQSRVRLGGRIMKRLKRLKMFEGDEKGEGQGKLTNRMLGWFVKKISEVTVSLGQKNIYKWWIWWY